MRCRPWWVHSRSNPGNRRDTPPGPGRPPIGLALSGKSPDRWNEKSREYSFYDLKGAVDAIAADGRIGEMQYVPVNNNIFRDGYGFELHLSDKVIGSAGLIKEEMGKIFDIKQPVYLASLDFGLILKRRKTERVYEPLPRFPAAPRDLC